MRARSFVKEIPFLKYGALVITAVAISLPASAQTGMRRGFGSGTPVATSVSGFGSEVGPVFCSIQTTTAGTGTTVTPLPGTNGFGNPQCALTGEIGKTINFGFVAEGALPVTFVLAQTQPTLDASLLGSVNAGQAELRERVTYPTSTNMMTIEYFAVPAGTALPFPATPLAAPGTVFARLNVLVQNIIFTDGSSPSVLLDGTVQASPLGQGVFGTVVGRAAAVSLGVAPPLTIPGLTDMTGATGTTDGTTQVPTVAEGAPGTTNATMLQVMVAGNFVTATPTAASTLSFGTATPPSGGGGTPGGTAPVVSFAPVPASVTQRQFMLDASPSASASGEPLTFAWSSIGNLAAISAGSTATPIVTFDAGSRDYVFQVAVTDAQGFTSVGTITVHYTGI